MSIVASSVRAAELALLNAPFEPGGWEAALVATARATGSAAAQLIGVGGPMTLSLNIVAGDVSADHRYFADPTLYGSCNWRINTVCREGAIQYEPHYRAYAAVNATADYDDAVSDLDLPLGCQSAFLIEPGRMVGMSLLRRTRDGACDDEVLHGFARLAFQADRAVRAQLAMDGETAALMIGDVASARCATLLLDHAGRVCAMTDLADLALGAGPFRVLTGGFGLTDRSEDQLLQSAMARLLRKDGLGDPIVHQALVGNCRWSMTIVRLPRCPHGLGFEPALAITLRDRRAAGRAAAV